MQNMGGRFIVWVVAMASFAMMVHAQEATSLGDAARQARHQKQQTKETQTKSGQTTKKPRVITDEDVLHSGPEENAPTAPASGSSGGISTPPAAGKLSAEEWRSKIQAQSDSIANLQSSMDKLNQSVQFAPGNCVSGCVQWNERQMQKQQEVDRMQQELKQQQKQLEEMQEAARQQGYGSSVTDP